jgi:hypothetical protein
MYMSTILSNYINVESNTINLINKLRNSTYFQNDDVLISLKYSSRSNLLIINNNKIYRYDPFVSNEDYGQNILDKKIKYLFLKLLPSYVYIGNIFKHCDNECDKFSYIYCENFKVLKSRGYSCLNAMYYLNNQT